jgi:hypothetical protein
MLFFILNKIETEKNKNTCVFMMAEKRDNVPPFLCTSQARSIPKSEELQVSKLFPLPLVEA